MKCRRSNGHNHRQSSNKRTIIYSFFKQSANFYFRYSFLESRKYLDNYKKRASERIALLCRDKPADTKCKTKIEQWYNYVLDISDINIFKSSHADNDKTKKCTKIPFTLVFYSKRMEQMNLNKILKVKGSVARLAGKIQLQQNILVATYRLHQQWETNF